MAHCSEQREQISRDPALSLLGRHESPLPSVPTLHVLPARPPLSSLGCQVCYVRDTDRASTGP